MSLTVRPTEGIDPNMFANAFATTVEQILAAQGFSQSRYDNPYFAISPSLDEPNILDYSTGTGAKIFSKATEPLKTCFNIKSPNIRTLLNEIQVRSESFGLNGLFQINTSNNQENPKFQNLLTTHEMCSTQQVQLENAGYMNTLTRKRHNNYQLFVCLTNSVDNHTKRMLVHEEPTYTSNCHSCSVIYLKLLIQKAKVNTRAAASHICRLLTQLDVYMVKDAKNDIAAFNEHVQE
jgi:hypothetical protein